MGGGGTIKIFCQNFLSHIAEIFPRSESFSVSLLQGIEKVWIREEVGVSRFPVELFCLTVPKSFIW